MSVVAHVYNPSSVKAELEDQHLALHSEFHRGLYSKTVSKITK